MIVCDTRTENGIPYNANLYLSNFEYETVVEDLDKLVVTRRSIMGGNGTVTAYSLGSRSVTRNSMTAEQIMKLWDDLWAKKKQLEGGVARRAVGVVLRDW